MPWRTFRERWSRLDVARQRRAKTELLCMGVLIFFAGGIDFGFNALKPALLDAGVYRERCDVLDSVRPCDAQLLAIDAIFQYTTAAVNVAALFLGMLLDRIGRRKACLVGAVSWYVGFTIFTWSDSESLDLFSFGLSISAMGGALFFFSALSTSLLFPEIGGMIDSLLTVLWDLSSLVFVILATIYFGITAPRDGHTLSVVLAVYSTVIVVGMLVFVYLYIQDTTPPETFSGAPPETSPSPGFGRTIFMCCTPSLLSLLCCTAIGIQFVYFSMSTVFEQARWASGGDDAEATSLLRWFNALLPALAVPNWVVMSAFLVQTEDHTHWRVVACAIASISITLLAFAPVRWQILSYALLIGWRQLLFMSFYATIHTLFRHLSASSGRLTGLGLTCGGVLAMLNPTLTSHVVVAHLHGDYRWFNVCNSAVYVTSCLICCLLLMKEHRVSDTLVRLHADHTAATVLPSCSTTLDGVEAVLF